MTTIKDAIERETDPTTRDLLILHDQLIRFAGYNADAADTYLDSLNKDTVIAFKSGDAMQTRTFKGE